MPTIAQNQMLIPAWVTVDINGALQTGNRVSMANYHRFTFTAICNNQAGVITFEQFEATAATGGTSTTMVVITDYWEMNHASSYITDGLQYAHTNRTAAATVVTTTGASVVRWDVTSDQMTAGYTHLHVNLITETGGACICAAFYTLSEPRYGRDILAAAT